MYLYKYIQVFILMQAIFHLVTCNIELKIKLSA